MIMNIDLSLPGLSIARQSRHSLYVVPPGGSTQDSSWFTIDRKISLADTELTRSPPARLHWWNLFSTWL
jgi:hypothetical protein